MRTSAVKRFMELWHGDPSFRDAVAAGAGTELGQRFQLDIDPEALRVLWDPRDEPNADGEELDPGVRSYLTARESLRSIGQRLTRRFDTGNRTHAGWRARQMARNVSQTDPAGWTNPHFPFAIELARGCTIQCDYCCFDAPKLQAVARFDREKEALFRGVLEVLGDFFGDAARTGFLYWATDPLDNCDYERYVSAFADCLGTPPRTTTAAWYRNIERTKRLLSSGMPDADAGVNRFSINSLEHLHLCLERFTPDELANVALVLQNPESTYVKCAAGRGIVANPDAPVDTNTNLSGFLINLVEQSVKLIAPCSDLARWPLGYAVFREIQFGDAAALECFLAECESEPMRDRFDDQMVPTLRSDFKASFGSSEQPLVLTTDYASLTFDDPVDMAILRSADGEATVGQIVAELMASYDAIELYAKFRRLYMCGLFEHLPVLDQSSDPGFLAARRLPGSSRRFSRSLATNRSDNGWRCARKALGEVPTSSRSSCVR